jgi:6-phosphogluconate dehydrogenase
MAKGGLSMKLAMVGLGRMGANMVRRLVAGGHTVIAYNRTREVTDNLAKEIKITPVYTYEDLIQKLDPPRVIWLMVPAGKATEDILMDFANRLSPGDILIDGGNSHFKDTVRVADVIEAKGIHFIDVGTSGGVWGISEGYSMMIGGDSEIIHALNPIFQTLAPSKDIGWGRVGPHGSGHYVKMVHNGIEYGMMEAYAEGFEIMKARKEFNLDLYQITQIWSRGSVVRSWLLELIGNAIAYDQSLEQIQGYVEDSGEGRWTVLESIEESVPAPAIALSLMRRFSSRQEDSYAAKLLAAMRNQFGGHAIKKGD